MEQIMIHIRFSVVKCGVYKATIRWEDANSGSVIREHSHEYPLMSLSDALRLCLEREVSDARAEGYDDIFAYSDEEYFTLKKIAKKLGVKYYGWEADEDDMEEYAEYE